MSHDLRPVLISSFGSIPLHCAPLIVLSISREPGATLLGANLVWSAFFWGQCLYALAGQSPLVRSISRSMSGLLVGMAVLLAAMAVVPGDDVRFGGWLVVGFLAGGLIDRGLRVAGDAPHTAQLVSVRLSLAMILAGAAILATSTLGPVSHAAVCWLLVIAAGALLVLTSSATTTRRFDRLLRAPEDRTAQTPSRLPFIGGLGSLFILFFGFSGYLANVALVGANLDYSQILLPLGLAKIFMAVLLWLAYRRLPDLGIGALLALIAMAFLTAFLVQNTDSTLFAFLGLSSLELVFNLLSVTVIAATAASPSGRVRGLVLPTILLASGLGPIGVGLLIESGGSALLPVLLPTIVFLTVLPNLSNSLPQWRYRSNVS